MPQILFTIALVPSVILALLSPRVRTGTNKLRGLFWGLISGLIAAAGNIAFYRALESGADTAIAIPLTNVYPLVTIIIAYFVFRERLNWIQCGGIMLAVAAIILLSGEARNLRHPMDLVHRISARPWMLWSLGAMLCLYCHGLPDWRPRSRGPAREMIPVTAMLSRLIPMFPVKSPHRFFLLCLCLCPCFSLLAAPAAPRAVETQHPGELRLSIPRHRAYLFTQGTTFDLLVKYAGSREKAKTIAVALESKDFFGTTTPLGAKTMTAPVNSTKEAPFVVETKTFKYGIHYLVARATDASGRLVDQATLAIGITSGTNATRAAAGEFCYGVCTHAGSRQIDPTHPYWQWLASLGVDYARFDFSWDWVQPSNGPFHFEDVDALVNRHLAIGVTPAPILCYFARWFSSDRRTAPTNLDPYYNYVENTVAHFKSRVKSWETWNEADWKFWPNPFDRYIEMYQESYRRIKSIDPGAKVMNSGWAFLNSNQSMQKAGNFHQAVRTNLDILAFHAHGDLAELKRKQIALAGIVERCGLQQTALWDNESGWSSHSNRTEQTQAEMLVKKIIHSQSAGWEAYFWYDLVNDGADPNNGEHNFGLVRANWAEPKPAYLGYHALIRLMRSTTFRKFISLDNKTSCYCFEKGGETTCVLWTDDPSPQPASLEVGEIASPKVVDLMGNASPVPYAKGQISTTVSATPSYLRWQRTPASTEIRPTHQQINSNKK